jgi:octaprenyl-diphosphate synthase
MKKVPHSSREKQLGDVASPLDPGVMPRRGGEDALSGLISLVDEDLEACNRVIVERMDSPVADPNTAHIVAAGNGCDCY